VGKLKFRLCKNVSRGINKERRRAGGHIRSGLDWIKGRIAVMSLQLKTRSEAAMGPTLGEVALRHTIHYFKTRREIKGHQRRASANPELKILKYKNLLGRFKMRVMTRGKQLTLDASAAPMLSKK